MTLRAMAIMSACNQLMRRKSVVEVLVHFRERSPDEQLLDLMGRECLGHLPAKSLNRVDTFSYRSLASKATCTPPMPITEDHVAEGGKAMTILERWLEDIRGELAQLENANGLLPDIAGSVNGSVREAEGIVETLAMIRWILDGDP